MNDSDVLATINSVGPTFQVISQPDLEGKAWRCCDLVENIDGVAEKLVLDHARFREIEVVPVAASLFFQRYCHRICAISLASWLLTSQPLTLDPFSTLIVVTDASPRQVVLESQAHATSLQKAFVKVTDNHLYPVAACLHRLFGVSLSRLHGNIAAGFAGAGRHLSLIVDAAHVQEVLEPLLVADKRLRDAGSFRLIPAPNRHLLFYDRATCCQWYEAPGSNVCTWCNKRSHDERTSLFINMARQMVRQS